ncbi:MAG: hypothetical protein OIF50_05040, partial [Flavobacteriaceae bacterium]|nr:hypothetical protein [Flavobacteriaceae bacterium]
METLQSFRGNLNHCINCRFNKILPYLSLVLYFGLWTNLVSAQSPGAVSQGLEVWLKADEITAAVADANVETWTNQALGNAAATAPTQATVNSRPIFRAGSHSSAINFNPTLSFDATDDKFDFSDLEVGNYQVFAVANKTDITQTGNLINLAGTGKHDIYLTNGGLKSANKGVS